MRPAVIAAKSSTDYRTVRSGLARVVMSTGTLGTTQMMATTMYSSTRVSAWCAISSLDSSECDVRVVRVNLSKMSFEVFRHVESREWTSLAAKRIGDHCGSNDDINGGDE